MASPVSSSAATRKPAPSSTSRSVLVASTRTRDRRPPTAPTNPIRRPRAAHASSSAARSHAASPATARYCTMSNGKIGQRPTRRSRSRRPVAGCTRSRRNRRRPMMPSSVKQPRYSTVSRRCSPSRRAARASASRSAAAGSQNVAQPAYWSRSPVGRRRFTSSTGRNTATPSSVTKPCTLHEMPSTNGATRTRSQWSAKNAAPRGRRRRREPSARTGRHR